MGAQICLSNLQRPETVLRGWRMSGLENVRRGGKMESRFQVEKGLGEGAKGGK